MADIKTIKVGTTSYNVVARGLHDGSTNYVAAAPTTTSNAVLETSNNKATSITDDSTKYPTAKAVFKKYIEMCGFDTTQYQLVKFIQSSGAQWINSGARVKGNTRIKAGITFTDAFNYNMMYGNWSSFALSLRAENTVCAAGGGANTQNSGNVCGTNSYYEIDHRPGTLIIGSSSVTLGSTSNTASKAPIYIFAAGSGAGTTPYSWTSYGKGRIHFMQIYEGDEIVSYFLPCYRKSDNVIGLYELLTGKFYVNQGSGTFTKGANITL